MSIIHLNELINGIGVSNMANTIWWEDYEVILKRCVTGASWIPPYPHIWLSLSYMKEKATLSKIIFWPSKTLFSTFKESSEYLVVKYRGSSRNWCSSWTLPPPFFQDTLGLQKTFTKGQKHSSVERNVTCSLVIFLSLSGDLEVKVVRDIPANPIPTFRFEYSKLL